MKMKKVIFTLIFCLLALNLNLALAEDNLKQQTELLKLALNVFVENNDLDNAYKTALKGYKLNKRDIFWLQWLAQISIWQGKTNLAFSYYKQIYKLKPSLNLSNKIIKLGLELNQLDKIVDLLEEKVRKKEYLYVDSLIKAYIYIGSPEKVFALLKKIPKKIAFNYYFIASELAFSLGELDLSLFYLKEIEKVRKLNSEEVNLYAKILLIKRRYDHALQKLYSIKDKMDFTEPDYWYNLSDLSWLMQKDEIGLEVNYFLFQHDIARKVDFERLGILSLKKKDFDLAKRVYLEAWKKYKEPIYFLNYAYVLDRLKDYKLLYTEIEKFSQEDKHFLENNINILLLKAKSLTWLGKKREALDIYLELYLKYRQNSLAREYIYAAIELGETKDLLTFLRYLEENKLVDESLYLVVGSAYTYLQYNQKAIFYYDKYLDKNKQDISFLVDYADVLGSLEEYKNREIKLRKRAYALIKERIKQDDKFLTNKDNLYLYLRLSFYFDSPGKIKKLLAKAKEILPEEEYLNLYYSYLLARGSYEKAIFLQKRYGFAPPWAKMSMNLEQDNREELARLTQNFLFRLPIRDEVESLRRIGRIDRSKEVAFSNLDKNKKDFLLYKQFKDLIEESEDKIHLATEASLHKDYDIWTNRVLVLSDWNKYLSYSVLLEDKLIKERDNNLFNLPDNISKYTLSFSYKRERKEVKFSLWKIVSKQEVWGGKLEFSSYLNNRLNLRFRVYGNDFASENLLVETLGLREGIGFDLVYDLTDSWQTEFSQDFSRYRDLKYNLFGQSRSSFWQISKKLRVGYPSLTLRNYWLYNSYAENQSSYLNRFSVQPPDLLPADFWETGLVLDFGLENRDNYNRVWRPFGEFGVVYNNQNGWGPFLELGVGGSLLGQDNLALGFGYSKELIQEGEGVYRFYGEYNYWF